MSKLLYYRVVLSLSQHPWQKKILSGANFSRILISLRDEYDYNIFSTEKKANPHPFHVKSDWKPPVQPSAAPETFLEEVKFELASIEFDKPKDNMSTGERQALKELSRNKSIILKKIW